MDICDFTVWWLGWNVLDKSNASFSLYCILNGFGLCTINLAYFPHIYTLDVPSLLNSTVVAYMYSLQLVWRTQMHYLLFGLSLWPFELLKSAMICVYTLCNTTHVQYHTEITSLRTFPTVSLLRERKIRNVSSKVSIWTTNSYLQIVFQLLLMIS